MNKFIDLHTHSTCSDGTLTPSEVVKLAKEKGLSAIALTDHDTIDGLHEAIETGKEIGIEVITGIEFSVAGDTEMHLLGLDFDLDCPAITDILDEMIVQREKRNYIVIELLEKLGIHITIDEIHAEATSPVTGRSQIAKVMLKKGYVSSIKEAFDKYLAFGKPAFVERSTLTPEKAIDIIHKSGGKAFLAHLNQTGKSDNELYELLTHLKKYGLDGIEGYYTEYTDDMNTRYRKMAENTGLMLSGGSDFHGTNKDGYEIGTGKGNLQIPYELIENFRNCS
ncbi:MAG: PHP domain-containing protein [Clostridia bacterium]|nr:PHP domain-containing protein [Clostridia bacterium]